MITLPYLHISRHQMDMGLPLVLEEFRSGRVLPMAPLTPMRLGDDLPHDRLPSGYRSQGGARHGPCGAHRRARNYTGPRRIIPIVRKRLHDCPRLERLGVNECCELLWNVFTSRLWRHGLTRVGLENVRFSFRTGFIDAVAIQTKIIPGWSHNWQVKLRNLLGRLFRMSFSQVVDQHATSLEAHHAFRTFVNEPLKLFRRDFWEELFDIFVFWKGEFYSFPLCLVDPFGVLAKLVFSFKLPATFRTKEFPVVGMLQFVKLELIRCREGHGTLLASILARTVECPDMLANHGVSGEFL